MFARAEHIRRNADGMATRLQRFDRRTCRDAAHDGHRDGMVAIIIRRHAAAAANLSERALDDARREAAPAAAAGGCEFGQLDHFDCAGAVGEAANEAAFFQRGNEAVNAGLRAQVEGVLHLIEGGRYAQLLQPFTDEPQKFVLFARQHLDKSPVCCPSVSETSGSEARGEYPAPDNHHQSSETNHERTLSVPYVFRNHLIFRQRRACCVKRRDGLRREAGGCRKPCLHRPRAQTADVSKVPVPQRDSQAVSCPVG